MPSPSTDRVRHRVLLFTVLLLMPFEAVGGGGVGPRGGSHAAPSTSAHPAERPASRDEAWELLPEESILAVVTRRAGPAARLAHDHLVVATGYRTILVFSRDAPEESRFSAELPTEGLVVDDPGEKDRWQGRLQDLGILDSPFGGTSPGDRDRIRMEMLARGQLDADGHPEIRVRLTTARPRDSDDPDMVPAERVGDFPWVAEVELTVRGRTASTPVAARYEMTGGDTGEARLRVEATGSLRFTELGIEPYSAFLGAVRNADRFHLYLMLEARRER